MSNPKYLRPGFEFATARLVEEAGELQQAVGKLLRWGPESFNPDLPKEQQESNADAVKREAADVIEAIDNWLSEDIKRRFGLTVQTTASIVKPSTDRIRKHNYCLIWNDKLLEAVSCRIN